MTILTTNSFPNRRVTLSLLVRNKCSRKLSHTSAATDPFSPAARKEDPVIRDQMTGRRERYACGESVGFRTSMFPDFWTRGVRMT